jgi:two-component system osmolarity sensor histidine kinase EnvZ
MNVMHFLKKLLPKTLLARGVLIVVLPVLLVQAVTIYIFFERHLDNVGRYARLALAGEVSFLTYLMTNDDERREVLTYLFEHQTGIKAQFFEHKKLPEPPPKPAFAELYVLLKNQIDLPMYVTRDGGNVLIAVEFSDGLLELRTTAKRIETQTVDIFLLWMSGAGVLFLYIAVLFLRNQIRPIRELADAAERFGKGQDIADFKPSGAAEVRRAGRAFMVMRERIARQIKTRTEMLAGISHDLRTPLTRMKLELAMLKNEAAAKELSEDVTQMEHMINEYLDFAKGVSTEENVSVDLADVLKELADNYLRQKHMLEIGHVEFCFISIRETAFRRMLTNVIDNAFRYANRCAVSARINANQRIEIMIDDDGVGIPASDREDVFRPFNRLDPARNLNQSGVGLGLTIAQDIAQSHGGSIELADSPLGGLRVIIKLPV